MEKDAPKKDVTSEQAAAFKLALVKIREAREILKSSGDEVEVAASRLLDEARELIEGV